jgi:hypothetical protein
MPRKAVSRELARQRRLEAGASDPTNPATWDDEELEHGRVRNLNGSFNGRPPGGERMTSAHYQAIQAELTKRRLSFAAEHMRDSLEPAVKRLRQILLDDNVRPADWLKAIELLTNRIWGMPKESILLGVDQMLAQPMLEDRKPPWQAAYEQMVEELDEQSLLHAMDILARRPAKIEVGGSDDF